LLRILSQILIHLFLYRVYGPSHDVPFIKSDAF
jgi:hypothetical protein